MVSALTKPCWAHVTVRGWLSLQIPKGLLTPL